VEQRRYLRVASFYVEAFLFVRSRVSAAILLARHGSHAEVGSVLSGRSEIPLSAAGLAEAHRLADRLGDVPLAAIHSSPRRRTRETAQIVADRHDIDVTIIDALDEIDFGDWTGQSFAALDRDPRWQRWNEARESGAAPGGETMAAATARATDHLTRIVADGPILCVTHCDIIRGVVAHVLGLHPDRLLSFDCDPASLTTLALWNGGGRVVALNERAA
jgi:broad specificity phosphatase PhoE